MTRLIHMRGDLAGMFLFFVGFFFGLWQVIVAWKRLNGVSLTGCPDRRAASYILGVAIMIASGAWYFSRRGHFASPDLEGVETLIVMVGGLVVSALLHGALAHLAFILRRSWRNRGDRPAAASGAAGEEFGLEDEGERIPCTYFEAVGDEDAAPLLVLHDYGGSRTDVSSLASWLASRGHPALTVDLDGHGENPRGIEDVTMAEPLGRALQALAARAGTDEIGAIGVGLGGLLAIELASSGKVARAIAVDPPTRDEAGHHDINAMREFGIGGTISETFKPSARARGGGSISLSKLVASLPTVRCTVDGGPSVTIVGTRGSWLNSPASLADFAHQCSPYDPILLKGTHESLVGQDATLEIASEIVG